jgi:G:T-mismatch repair DNA endonuclease (very short patch repair protein)
MAILEEETYKQFGYYSRELTPHSGKKIICECDKCGKIRILNKWQYKALCSSCVRSGENGPKWIPRIKKKCKYCGKEFETQNYILMQGGGLFCSKGCNYKWQSENNRGKKNPRWKGGKIKRVCSFCGKEFGVYPCVINLGEGIFCSRSCTAKAQRHNTKSLKTKPELIFEEICKRNTLPFHFVGDGALWLGNANPDFIHKTRKLCVEIYGDYWHSPLLNRNIRPNMTLDFRRKQLKGEGYKLIVLWESDLKRKDTEAFVLNYLQKQKFI